MRKKEVNIAILIGAFLLFGLSVGLSLFYVFALRENNAKYFRSYNREEYNELKEVLSYQDESDRKIRQALEDESYTFYEPFVLVNPYKINPLSAVIAFNTKNKTSIEVYINDEFVFKMKESKQHVIPIYGLYNNAVNIIALKSGGNTKEIEIKTNIYNFEHEGINIGDIIGDKSHYFLLGDLNNQDSKLRGFDQLGNMVYYLDLDYVSGVRFYNSRLYVGYNSRYSKNNDLRDIKLEMDFLGKIYGISTNLSDLDVKDNVDNGIDGDIMVGTAVNIYRKNMNNVDLSKRTDNLKYTDYSKVSTGEISNELDAAKIYEKKFKVAMNGEYLTYDIDEKGMLVLVNKNTFNTYMYSLGDSNFIKVEPLGQSSLYLYIDGEYYTLLTTIRK